MAAFKKPIDLGELEKTCSRRIFMRPMAGPPGRLEPFHKCRAMQIDGNRYFMGIVSKETQDVWRKKNKLRPGMNISYIFYVQKHVHNSWCMQ